MLADYRNPILLLLQEVIFSFSDGFAKENKWKNKIAKSENTIQQRHKEKIAKKPMFADANLTFKSIDKKSLKNSRNYGKEKSHHRKCAEAVCEEIASLWV